MNQTILIYDLDDTLVDTSEVYYFARKNFLNILKQQNFSIEQALDVFENIDTHNVEIYGHKPERYKISMLQTYETLCKKSHITKSEIITNAIDVCGNIKKKKMPELISDAEKLLKWGKKRYRQVLFTRGSESLQTQKIKYAGLSDFFDVIKIVEIKNTNVLCSFLKEIRANSQDCWIIGDSIKSDINPAIELGINCILYLYEHHSYFWQQEYGHEAKGEFYCVKKLLKIQDIIECPENFKKISILV